MNPMEEYKQQHTKEIEFGTNHKLLIRSLSAKEITEIESIVALSSAKDTVSEYQVRKVETLIKCIVSMDNILLRDFPEVKVNISKSISEHDAIRDEINSWDNLITEKIYAYYLQFIKERSKEIEDKINFQISLS